MNAVACVDALIEGRTSFKEAGGQLEALPPDHRAVDRLVAAYCDQRIEGWIAVYLLGCVGHTSGYDTAVSILFSNQGKSYAGEALVKIDKRRAFTDLRQAILNAQHQSVRRDAAYGLALYQSEEAINVFLIAHVGRRVLPLNQLAYNLAECNPNDTILLGLLRSLDSSKQKLAFAVIEWLVAENMQLRRPGREVADLVRSLLQDSGRTMNPRRREKLTAWSEVSLADST